MTRVEVGPTRAKPVSPERPLRRFADSSMTSLARLLVRVFFRSIEIVDGEHLPDTGPVVLVANHTNGLVDGLLLMAALRRFPRFLGKSTLFGIPPLWPFLKLGGVIPVYRSMDAVPGDHNVSAFATSRTLLERGGVVAVFPEGISHDQSELQPLKTGAARIALDACADGGAEELTTLAVGLVYDAKARFRSRALVRVGEPVAVADWVSAYRRDERSSVRAMTEDLAGQIAAVSPSFSSWTEATRLSWVAEVVVRSPGSAAAADTPLADKVEVAARLGEAQQDRPGSLDQLFADFATYERDLTLLGVSDAQLAAGAQHRRLRRAVLWSGVRVALALPFALAGALVHLVPFQIVKQAAKHPVNEGIKATVKLLGSVVLYAVTYVVLGVVVGRAYGPCAGLAAAAAAPLCGYLAVRMLERVKRIGGVLDGWRALRGRGDVLAVALAHRATVVEDVATLLCRS